jgi:hypothetical protein
MIEIWSCNPKDIPEWTYEKELELQTALVNIFNLDPATLEDAKLKLKEKYNLQ